MNFQTLIPFLSNAETIRVIHNEKGFSVAAARTIRQKEVVCEYDGELISQAEGRKRELALQHVATSYMFFFKLNGKSYCLDATKDEGSFGRLINHSRLADNLKPIAMLSPVTDKPAVFLFAKRNIKIGEELLFHYGETRKDVVDANPWLLT